MKYKIIRLKDNPISEKYATDCVEQAAKLGINVEYFDAINGLEYQSHLAKLNIHPKYKFKKGRAGVYGCFLSHYYLWEACAKKNVAFCILEHDGYFVRPLPENILDQFKDVLKLDNLDPFSKLYNDALIEQSSLDISITKYNNATAKFLHKNETGNYMRGAYGYIIKPHAAARLLHWIKKNGFVPADNQLGDAIVDIQVTVPTFVRLHPDYYNRISELTLTGNPSLL